MKRIWPFLALGIVAYLTFALITLPASLVVGRLRPAIDAAGIEGTVWNGSAQVVSVAGANLGALTWNLHVLSLLTLKAKADVKITRSDGFAQGVVAAGRQRVQLEDFSAALPIASLPAQLAPGGWVGNVNARLTELTLDNGWPTSANGTIEVTDLVGPARRPANLGSYQIKFPAPTSPPDSLTGTVNDISGPIQIAGTIQFKAADRSYLLEGQVATKPDAPPEFARTLEYLGPPDEQGRRPFSLSGTM